MCVFDEHCLVFECGEFGRGNRFEGVEEMDRNCNISHRWFHTFPGVASIISACIWSHQLLTRFGVMEAIASVTGLLGIILRASAIIYQTNGVAWYRFLPWNNSERSTNVYDFRQFINWSIESSAERSRSQRIITHWRARLISAQFACCTRDSH